MHHFPVACLLGTHCANMSSIWCQYCPENTHKGYDTLSSQGLQLRTYSISAVCVLAHWAVVQKGVVASLPCTHLSQHEQQPLTWKG